jgi:hypothetical protein
LKFYNVTLIVHLTLGIAAGGADEATLLIDQQVTAVGALPSQVLGQSIVFQFRLTIITSGMFLKHAGNGIGTREYSLALFPGNGWTTDTAELPYHLGNIYPRP